VAKKVKEPKPYEKYRHIAAWGKMLGSMPYYIKDRQKEALADNAPITAIYKRDGKWDTFEEIQVESTRHELENIISKMRS